MTATRVELPNPGDSLTMQVTECRPATTGNFPGMEFIGMDGQRLVVVEIPMATTQRQLERLKLPSSQLAGKILTLSRSYKLAANQKPFWDISVVGQGNGAPPASSSVPAPARAQEPASQPVAPTINVALPGEERFAAMLNLYDLSFAHAIRVAQRAKELGYEVDPAAIGATIFIQAAKQSFPK